MLIYTKNGRRVKVDDDFVIPPKHSLTVTSHGYAALVYYTGEKTDGGWYKYKRTYLHRYITGAPEGVQVDHIDGDRLNNTSKNLRICTNQENNFNKGPNKKNTSGYKGVYFSKQSNRWIAQITVNYKSMHVGSFETAEQAAIAYNEASRRYHGEYGHINKVCQ